MSEMVERVARAIEPYLAGIYPDAHLAQIARAAIAAMREPTEEMIKSGWDYSKLSATPEGMWRVMIDEMLKETTP